MHVTAVFGKTDRDGTILMPDLNVDLNRNLYLKGNRNILGDSTGPLQSISCTGKGKKKRPGPCLLCQGPPWARDCPSHHGGKGKRATSFGKGSKNSSPFRQAYLEGNEHDWITGAGAFAVSVPSLQNFVSFDLDAKFILDSGATMSMGGVDLVLRIREIYADAGLQLTSRPVSPLRFSFANGQEDVSTSVLPVPCLPWKVIFFIRGLNAPGPVLLGADVHEDLGLVFDHVDCSMFVSHLKLEDKVERLPSRHLCPLNHIHLFRRAPPVINEHTVPVVASIHKCTDTHPRHMFRLTWTLWVV